MPTITRGEVSHLARLARLSLSDEELDHFAGQLDMIVGVFARIGELDVADVPPTSHPLPLTNVMRPDESRPGLPPAEFMAVAPAVEEQRFRVPRILDEEV